MERSATNGQKPDPGLRERHHRAGGKTVRARGWAGLDQNRSSGYDRTTLLTDLQQLCLPAQDRTSRRSIREADGVPGPPYLRSYGQLVAFGEGEHVFFKGEAHSRPPLSHRQPHTQEYMGSTNWTQGENTKWGVNINKTYLMEFSKISN